MKIYYCVEVPLEPGSVNWFTVCRVLDPVAVGEIVRVLLACGQTGPQQIRIRLEFVD